MNRELRHSLDPVAMAGSDYAPELGRAVLVTQDADEWNRLDTNSFDVCDCNRARRGADDRRRGAKRPVGSV